MRASRKAAGRRERSLFVQLGLYQMFVDLLLIALYYLYFY